MAKVPPTVEEVSTPEKVEAQVSDDQEPVETTISEPTTNQQQLEKIKQQLINILSNFPEYSSEFYQEYKSQITVVGLIIVAILTLRLIIGLVGVLEEIPILSFTFEFVGMGYTIWFIYRYLLGKSKRQELLEKIQDIKADIVGKNIEE